MGANTDLGETPDPGDRTGARERIEWTHPAELDGSQVVVFSNQRRMVRMVHEAYGLLTQLRGHVRWTCRGETFAATPGKTCVWEPGDFHATLSVDLADQRGLVIEKPQLDQMVREMGVKRGGLHTLSPESADPLLFKALGRFHRSMETSSTALERQSHLSQCVRLAVERALESSPRLKAASREKDAVRLACDYLRDHSARNVSLAELADVSRLNRFQILRAFTAQIGAPPHAYLIAFRISRARALLARGILPALVATGTGFFDQSHLTRHFSRVVGCTPARFARDMGARPSL